MCPWMLTALTTVRFLLVNPSSDPTRRELVLWWQNYPGNGKLHRNISVEDRKTIGQAFIEVNYADEKYDDRRAGLTVLYFWIVEVVNCRRTQAIGIQAPVVKSAT